jgi:Leucine-rich repeat (LRR) protein
MSVLTHISALPDVIGQLSSLKTLDCYGCKLTGTYLGQPVRLLTSVVCAALPESIGNLQNLVELYANSNQIESKFHPLCSTSCPRSSVLTHILALPDSFGQLSSLEFLNLEGNKLTGTIYF